LLHKIIFSVLLRMIYSCDYNTIDANEFVAMSAVSDSYELTRVYSCELIGASVRAPYCSKSSFFSSLGSQYDAARSALERRQQISIVSRYAPVLMLIDPPCRLPTGQTDRQTDGQTYYRYIDDPGSEQAA